MEIKQRGIFACEPNAGRIYDLDIVSQSHFISGGPSRKLHVFEPQLCKLESRCSTTFLGNYDFVSLSTVPSGVTGDANRERFAQRVLRNEKLENSNGSEMTRIMIIINKSFLGGFHSGPSSPLSIYPSPSSCPPSSSYPISTSCPPSSS